MTVALPVSTEPEAVPEARRRSGLWRRLPTRAKVGAVLLGAFILAAIVGPLVSPYDPSFQNPSFGLSLHPPDGAHLLGTTQSGQDVLAQLLTGIRLTLELALSVGVIASVLSIVAGVTAGYLAGL
jgi:peptide/nickel transport system permease protein